MPHNSHILLATASLLAEGENRNKVYMTKCQIKDYTLKQFMLFSSNHRCASVSQCCFCNENRLLCSVANLQGEWELLCSHQALLDVGILVAACLA